MSYLCVEVTGALVYISHERGVGDNESCLIFDSSVFNTLGFEARAPPRPTPLSALPTNETTRPLDLGHEHVRNRPSPGRRLWRRSVALLCSPCYNNNSPLAVIGIGLFFSVFMIVLTALQARYTAYSPKDSEEFSTASRSVKPGLIASGIVSAWTWAATLVRLLHFCFPSRSAFSDILVCLATK